MTLYDYAVIVRAADILYLGHVHQEMVSHRHPKEYEKTKEPDFGIYHHSTSAASKKTREVLKTMFTDVFRFMPTKKFDMIVSNLVFHNFGKMRFKAYSHLSSWIQNRSFIVIGDLFFSRTTD